MRRTPGAATSALGGNLVPAADPNQTHPDPIPSRLVRLLSSRGSRTLPGRPFHRYYETAIEPAKS